MKKKNSLRTKKCIFWYSLWSFNKFVIQFRCTINTFQYSYILITNECAYPASIMF